MLNACSIQKTDKEEIMMHFSSKDCPLTCLKLLQQHLTSAVRILCHRKAVKASLAKDCRQHVATVGDKIKWLLAAG